MNTKKYFYTYDESDGEGKGAADLAEAILQDPELASVEAITIGYWGTCYEDSCQPIIDMMVAHHDKFAHVKELFFGDMGFEECEVSWIIQGDYDKLFEALPNLQVFRVKGQTGLSLGSPIVHKQLKHLEIIGGGLNADVFKELAEAALPALETLIVYIGQDSYGFDGSIEDIRPLASASRFPALKHLGLVNSEIQDDVTEMVLGSDILSQLEVLQLSYGTLTDKGGKLLLDHQDQLKQLKKLDLEYHFLTDDIVKQLSALPFEVNAADPQQPDEYRGEVYMYSMMGE